ncbi:FAD-linked oxidoreductase [Dendrothele bispora CBS 962.96]|uniref:Proline dehydrogenase n=1 Tax=Dendrothele bispora (strain CBS 962.96) TaxID=1314807 RepID=A0A4S8MRI3_DENBC|nr:FAD-linked oxidoreductase [Dendrothele bispora CBS 962.96]
MARNLLTRPFSEPYLMFVFLARKSALRTSFRCSQGAVFRRLGQRYASSQTTATSTLSLRRGLRAGLSGSLIVLVGTGLLGFNRVYADSQILDDDKGGVDGPTSRDSLGKLLRTYIVYSMCSIPGLIDAAPRMLDMLTSVPLVREVTQAFVRITFFDQFVGGDTAQQVVPLLRDFRSNNMGALFAYSIEVDEKEATLSTSEKKDTEEPTYRRIVNEMIHSIDVAADFEDEIAGNALIGRRTWVAVKMTALLPDAQSLVNLSSHVIATRKPPSIPFPGCPRPTDLEVLYRDSLPTSCPLTPEDVVSLRELHANLRRICTRAKERGVKIILDAEYSWYQPAIDALQLSLMREFNKYEDGKSIQPLVYGTFQAYLRRTLSYLAQSFEDADRNRYILGVKLVRGAYHPFEVAAQEARIAGESSMAISPDIQPPVWTSKEETDRCYNECAKVLIQRIKQDIESSTTERQHIGVLFGTHNWTSIRLILKELVKSGLASVEGDIENGVVTIPDEVTERLTMGQLYGMNDALSDYLVQRTKSSVPMVIKYVPYGALSEVMPYLSRRAIENKSVLDNRTAEAERRRAGKQIWARLFG